MLAKARNDDIARRAALSAPTKFLPRLLLCSGLPRASLVTMIDRLGRLGDSSSDRDSVYRQLLVQSASSDFDSSRLGPRRNVARKLLGRLAAYLRLNSLSLNGGRHSLSSTFLSWLTEECQNQVSKSSKLKAKKHFTDSHQPADALLLRECVSGSSILSRLSMEEATFPDLIETDVKSHVYLPDAHQAAPINVPAIHSDEESMRFLQKSLQDGDLRGVEAWLTEGTASADGLGGDTIATQLLVCFKELSHYDEATVRLLQKWIPPLTESQGGLDFYQHLFGNEKEPSALDAISLRCTQVWTSSHVSQLVEWVSSRQEDSEPNVCYNRLAQFLVSASGAPSGHVDSLLDQSTLSNKSFLQTLSKDQSEGLLVVGLQAIGEDSRAGETETKLCSRNFLAPSALLVLLLAGHSKEATRAVTKGCLTRCLDLTPNHRLAVYAVLLRLYLWQPKWMDLGQASVRSALIAAAERFPTHWVTWRSMLDDQLENMLDGLVVGGDSRLTRPLSDLSRSHPLLMLRLLPDLQTLLDRDATIVDLDPMVGRKVHGRHPSGPIESLDLNQSSVLRVTIRHWGYRYTEPLWLALLDVISSIPAEVLYQCGLHLGVPDFLSLYVRLLTVQRMLLWTTTTTLATATETTVHHPPPPLLATASATLSAPSTRLSTKVQDCLVAFQRTSPTGWQRWLATPIEAAAGNHGNCNAEQENVRNALVRSHLLTAEEALDSLQQSS